MESLDENDVVISGISGVYPNAENVEEFAEKLFAKENLLSKPPYMPVKLGKLKDVSKFDAEFFGFNQPHRVNVMEPMSRIIMEKAYEALVDSGTNPVTLKGKQCGVYIGVHWVDAEMLVYDKIQKGASLAMSRSFIPNRISHWLGVHGPSYVIDSACSSTLVALDSAFKAIRRGDCDSAIVGGCNTCLHPSLLVHLLKVGALSPKGESKVFDENASGFCKAECIGTFYLQRAKDARRVYARIINSGVNHDGSKPLFLSPWGPSQMKLLKRLYEESNIDSNSVAWFEAHATGTLVGDKQEVTGIDSVFVGRESPLLLGSVKSNMGHAEAAAAVGSITKVIIAMETGFIPPNINLTHLRKDIDAFQSGRIKVVTEKTPWNGGIVGVSAFGMGGVNAHVILQSFSKKKINDGLPNDDLPRIVGVSGRTEDAIDALLNRLELSSLDEEFISLLHEVHNHTLPSHPYRGFAILPKNERCVIKKVEKIDNPARPLVFVFVNYSSKWSNIYKSLEDIEVFQSTVSKCAVTLEQYGVNLVEILDNGENSLFNGIISAVTIQVALYDLLQTLNVIPDHVIGYFIGDLVCAYADGLFSLEKVITAAYHCASFLAKRYENKNTITVLAEKDHASLEAIVPRTFDLVFPSIISGPAEDVLQFLNVNRITYSKFLNSDFKIPPAEDISQLQILLQPIIQPKTGSERWLAASQKLVNAEYFAKMISGDISFGNVSVPSSVIAVEILTINNSNMLQKYLTGNSTNISLSDENRTGNVTNFLSSLGELYLLGKNPHFNRLYPAIKYPVSSRTKMIAPLIKWKHSTSWPVPFSSFQERMLSGERKVSVSLDNKEDAYITGHEIDSTVLYPGAGYLVLVWETLALVHGKIFTDCPVVFENVQFLKAVVMPNHEPVIFNIMVHKGTGFFEIMENSEVVAVGKVHVPVNIRSERIQTMTLVEEDSIILDRMDFYRHVLINGYNFKGMFRSIVQINSEGTKGRISWARNWITYLDGMLQTTLLDDTSDALRVPTEIEKIVIDIDKHNGIADAKVSELDVTVDKKLRIIECGGVQIRGVTLRPIAPKQNGKKPTLQKYQFTPFINNERKVSMKEAIYLFGQVIMDKLGQQKTNLKLAEIIDEDFNGMSAPLSTLFLNFVKEQPVFEIAMKICTNRESRRTENEITIVNESLPLTELVHVIICTNTIRKENKLKYITQSLHDGGFLVSREEPNTVFTVPTNFYLCCSILCNGDRLLLLKKRSKLNSLFKVIKVSCNNFHWVEELQEALKINGFERIILVAEKEPLNGILGFYNCLRTEKGTDNVRCFFIMDNINSFSADEKFFKSQIEKDLAVNVFKDEEWGCYIRQPLDCLPVVDSSHAFVNVKSFGSKRYLQWSQGPVTYSSLSCDNVIYVYYAAVNSTDALIYKRRLAIEAVLKDPMNKDYVLGMEFSGRASSGKRYMGLRQYGCLSTYVKLERQDVFVNEVPNNWSLEDAVTIPLAYYSALYALVMCGRLKAKESILIHSAGNSVAQAALNLALYFNCEIFVSVSSIDEKLFIKENFPFLADNKIINAADGSFVRIIEQETNGAGINIVLNSSSADHISSTVDCMAQNGRLIQTKRINLKNCHFNADKLLSKNISLYSAMLEDIFNMPQEMKQELKETLDEYVKNSAVKPLFRTAYFYTGIESAFEYASFSRHFGKCIVQIEPEEEELNVKPRIRMKKAYPRFLCKSDKSYVVCGGLGGMGMELVNWLVGRGCRKVVIASRTCDLQGSRILRINRWKLSGVKIVVSKVDISDMSQTEKLLDEAKALGDVGGIFNLAGILKDKTFKNQTVDNFETCAGPKFRGTFNLDRVSRRTCPQLEHFVVFSSVACGYGNVGQTNYGMFNSTIERICERRYEENLPALAVEWGAVGNVGMLVSFLDGNSEKSFAGLHMQPMKSCLEALDQFLFQKNAVVASLVLAEKKINKTSAK